MPDDKDLDSKLAVTEGVNPDMLQTPLDDEEAGKILAAAEIQSMSEGTQDKAIDTLKDPRNVHLRKLREANEVVEEDPDQLNEIFSLIGSGISLTQVEFLKSFPEAKALVITEEQLWQIEDCLDNNPATFGARFSYIDKAGNKHIVEAEHMLEPLVLFLEDLQ